MLYPNLIIFTAIIFITFIILYLEWGKFSKVYHNNHTFFDVFFIVVYPMEESLFLFLYYLDDPLKQSLWVSLIVIVICATVVMDKWLLKKQHTRTLKINSIIGEKQKQKQIERLKKFKKYIINLEKEKKDLINYALRKQKKLK